MDPENRFTPNEREKGPLRPLKFDDHSLGDLDSVTQINNIDESNILAKEIIEYFK